MSNKYFSSYDNKTIMADVDVHGHSLELTIENGKVTAIGGSAVGGDDGTWETKGYGAIVTDETDDVITDEDGNGIADETPKSIPIIFPMFLFFMLHYFLFKHI